MWNKLQEIWMFFPNIPHFVPQIYNITTSILPNFWLIINENNLLRSPCSILKLLYFPRNKCPCMFPSNLTQPYKILTNGKNSIIPPVQTKLECWHDYSSQQVYGRILRQLFTPLNVNVADQEFKMDLFKDYIKCKG